MWWTVAREAATNWSGHKDARQGAALFRFRPMTPSAGRLAPANYIASHSVCAPVHSLS